MNLRRGGQDIMVSSRTPKKWADRFCALGIVHQLPCFIFGHGVSRAFTFYTKEHFRRQSLAPRLSTPSEMHLLRF